MNKRKAFGKYVYLFFVCAVVVLLIFILTKILRIGLYPSVGSISIDEVSLTTGIDVAGQPIDSTTSFNSHQSKIYCFIKITSPKPVNVGIRWYYENHLIYDDNALVDGSRVFYIQPVEGELFPAGHYHLEIYLLKENLRAINFSVTE
jgi:hypothetical protein